MTLETTKAKAPPTYVLRGWAQVPSTKSYLLCALITAVVVVQNHQVLAVIGPLGNTRKRGSSSAAASFADAIDKYDFDVHFARKTELGIMFSNKLFVRGFYSGKHNEKLPAEISNLIHSGDTLISVNNKPVKVLKALTRAIRKATLPLVLRFRPGLEEPTQRAPKTFKDFRFNITFHTTDPPPIQISEEQLTVVHSNVEGVQMGDKLVAINGQIVVGAVLMEVVRLLRQAFTKEVLQCTPTHCQIIKAASFYDAKVLTFEPQVVEPRHSYTVHQVTGEADPHSMSAVPNKLKATLELLSGHLGDCADSEEVVFWTHVRSLNLGQDPTGALSEGLPCSRYSLVSLATISTKTTPGKPAQVGVDGCSAIGMVLKDMFVIASHGRCSPADKALNVQYAGGAAVFFPVNPAPGHTEVSVKASKSKLSLIRIPIFSLTNEAVKLLEKVLVATASEPTRPVVQLKHDKC